ncbi:MAG TPA: hypothetical protein VMR16_03885 [Candidatus Saccharimonadales bacterium]|nr:hypothetical protein [Candidatus Saccharimonadales bacterium]
MLINNNPTQYQNVGRWVQSNLPIQSMGSQRGRRFTGEDTGMPSTGTSKWMMRQQTASLFHVGYALNANRNFSLPYLDVVIEFNAQVQDAALTVNNVATGHTISVNGVGQVTTYQSGSGTGRWVLRINTLVDAMAAITYSYDGTGNATDVFTGVEITNVTNLKVDNFLTQKIRFQLKKSDNTIDVSETVNIGICTYTTETLVNDPWALWMTRQQQQTTTTDVNGQIDVDYYGSNIVGDSVYVIILRPGASPTESLIWPTTVQ